MRRSLRTALPVLLALVVGSCDRLGTDVDADGMSKVSVFLADAPGAVKAVWIKIDQIYLIDIDGAADGRIVKLLSAPTGLIEVTTLVDSVKALALAVPVVPGHYTELRFIIGGAVLQSKESRVFTFGDVTPPNGLVATGQLQCPSCSRSGLRVVFDVELKEGSDDIVLDFDVGQSFGHEAGKSGKWIMRPIIRALHDRRADKHDRDDDDDDDDDGGDDDGDRFASIEGTVRLGGAAAIPQCPAGRRRSLEDFIPLVTADSLKAADGSPLIATGSTDDDREFKIRRLKADTWTLGYKKETIVSDAGHKLVWVATVDPTEVDIDAGDEVEDVAYTITSVTCAEPTP